MAVTADSGTATSGTDFGEVTGITITIPANTASHTGTFSLSPTQDTEDEPDETVEVNGTTTVPGLLVTGAEVEITDDDTAPAVTLLLSDASIGEGGGIVTVTASLDHASSESTTVTVSVAPDTPATSSDYSLSTNTTLTIAANATTSTGTVTITGVDNDLDAADKTVQVKGAAVNGLGVTDPSDVQLTLEDNDARGVTVSATAVDVDEDDTATYTVVLTSQPTGDVTVTPSRESGDTDVTVSGALTFTALNWATLQTVTVSAAHDADALDDTAVIANAVSGGDYGLVAAASVDVTVDDDETPSSGVTLSVSPDSVGEGADATAITVTAALNGGTRGSATPVAVTADSGTATSGTDFGVVTGITITIPANTASHTGTFSLSPTQDTEDEPDETVEVNGTTTVPGLLVTGAEVEITDDDTAPAVTLLLSDASIGEGGGIVTVTASLDHASSESTTVTVSVAPDTPATSSDYSLSTNTTLTIAANATTSTGTVTITGVDNDLDAADKTVQVKGAAVNDLGVTDPSDMELTLEDDDTRGVTVSATAVDVDEDDTATYTVVLTSQPTGDVTVTPSRESGDTDVTVSGALTFTALNWATLQTVTVSAAHDADALDDTAVIANAVSGGDYGLVAAASVDVTVDDDETPSSGVTLSVSPDSVGEGAVATAITVTATLNGGTRDAATPVAVTADSGTATSGTDFGEVTGITITIPANTRMHTGTFSLAPTQDSEDEPDETVEVNGTTAVEGFAVTGAAVEIIDDDDDAAPTVTLLLSDASIGEGGGIATVTASLNHASSDPTTVTVSVSPDSPATSSDYSLSTIKVLTIAAESTASTGTVTVTGVDNDLAAADKTVQVKGAAVNDLGVTDPADVELTLEDDDTRGVTVSATAVDVDENDTATYTVVLTSQPTGDVTVTPSRESGDTDVTVSGALTFTALNWATLQTVTVSAAHDADALDDTAVIANAVSGGDYGLVAAASVDVTVEDDDETPSSGVTLSVSPDAVSEGAVATAITVTATLNGGTRDAATPVAVTADSGTATSGTDFGAVTGFTITIPANTRMHTGTFSLAPTQDSEDEPDETVEVNGTTAVEGFAVTGAAVEIIDDDDDAAPTVTLLLSDASIGEGGGIATVTASLSQTLDEPLSIDISTAPQFPATAEDYQLSSNATLTILSGLMVSADTVAITAHDNNVDSPDKAITISGAVAGNAEISEPESVTLTIEDDDERGITVSETELDVIEGGDGTYTVVLESEPTGTVTITPSRSTGDTDVTVSGTLTFTNSNWSLAQTVTVSAAEDDDSIADTATITHQVSGGDYEGEMVAPVAVKVSDDDGEETIVTLSLDPASVPEGAGQAGSPVTVTATLNHGGYGHDLDVTVSVTAGTATETDDFAAVQPSVIRIAAGETQGTARFTIIPVDDRIDEEDETLTVVASVSASNIVVEPASRMTLTIEDDDARRVTVHPTELYLREHESKVYTVVLDSQPTESVIVNVVTVETKISVSPSQLTFAMEDWSTPQVVTVGRERGSGGQVILTHDVVGSGFDTVPVADVRVKLAHSAAEFEAANLSLAATSRVLLNSVVSVFDGRRRSLENPLSLDENETLAKRIGAQLYRLALSAGGTGRGATHYRDSAGSMINAGSSFNAGVGSGFGVGAESSFGAGFSQENATGAMSVPGLGSSILGAGSVGMSGMPQGSLGVRGFDWERQLWGRSFAISLGHTGKDEEEAEGVAGWTLWGVGDLQNIAGAPESGRYDGELRSVYLGADRQIGEKWLTGIALSRSIGDVDYQFADESGASGGTLGTGLTNLYPYLLGQLSENLDVWAVGGIGRGDAEAKSQPLPETETGELGMNLAAAGFRLGMARFGAARLSMIGDAGYTSLTVDDGQGVLEGLQSTVQRVRLGIEGEFDFSTMQPFWQLGARYDGGDGQTGSGLDVVAGVRYTAPRINFESQGRWLLLHSATGYEEFSATASLTVSPDDDSSGFMLRFSPSWGQTGTGFAGMGSAMELWSDQSPIAAWNRAANTDADLSFASEFGYGFLMRRGILALTLSISRKGTAGQMYSLGIGYETLQELVARPLSLQLTIGQNTSHPGVYVYGFRWAYQF